MSSETQSKGVLDVLKSTWFIVLFVGGALVGYVKLQAQVADHEMRITRNEAAIVLSAQNYNTLAINIQEIKTTLEFIKDRVK